MAPEKSESEKSVVYTVPYVRETSQETSTKVSNLKIKLCGGVLITAVLVCGIVTAAYLLSSNGRRADQNLKTIEVTFQVNGKDKREEIRIDRSSEIAVFDDLSDEFTVVLDYGRNLAVFKNLKNNTCYFTNLEDIPMVGNVMQQEDEGSVARFFLADNEEGQKDGALIIESIIVLPGDYVAKTNNEVVSNLCTRSISFWGLVVEKPAMKNKNRHKRQGFPLPPICSLTTCIFGCCSNRCCIPVIIDDPFPGLDEDRLRVIAEASKIRAFLNEPGPFSPWG